MNAATPWVAALSLAAAALAAHAQDRVYRCGSSYSQEPCSGGSLVAVDDARSAGQVAQAQKVAQLDARLAEALVRERVQAERAAARQGLVLIGTSTPKMHGQRAERSVHPRAKDERITWYRAPGAN